MTVENGNCDSITHAIHSASGVISELLTKGKKGRTNNSSRCLLGYIFKTSATNKTFLCSLVKWV